MSIFQLTVAELRSMPLPTHDNISHHITGKNAPLDGLGGGIFDWSSASHTDDDRTFIVPGGAIGSVGPGWKRMIGPGEQRASGTLATWPKLLPDAAGIDNMAERSIGYTKIDQTVTAVAFVPDDALIANDDDAAELTVYKRDSAGINWVSVAHALTFTLGSGGTGNWVKFAPVIFHMDCAAVEAGSSLTFEINKIVSMANLGVVVPAGVIVVTTAVAPI
ncbi:MAG: hypothetical protein WC563_15760 [Brevundimonas sp.]